MFILPLLAAVATGVGFYIHKENVSDQLRNYYQTATTEDMKKSQREFNSAIKQLQYQTQLLGSQGIDYSKNQTPIEEANNAMLKQLTDAQKDRTNALTESLVANEKYQKDKLISSFFTTAIPSFLGGVYQSGKMVPNETVDLVLGDGSKKKSAAAAVQQRQQTNDQYNAMNYINNPYLMLYDTRYIDPNTPSDL